jgi:hypothetical protein
VVFVPAAQTEKDWRPKAPKHQHLDACSVSELGVEESVDERGR